MSVELSRVIERSVEDVFHFFAERHVQNHPRWDPDIELETETSGPMGVEMSGRVTFEELGPERTRLTQSVTVPDSIDEELVRSRMERSSRNIVELIEDGNEND